MSKEKQKIIELCNSSLEGKDLVVAIEAELAKVRPFDHNSDKPGFESCGLYEPIILKLETRGAITHAIEEIEKTLTKRELAVCVAKEHCKVVVDEDGMPEELKQLLSEILNSKGSKDKMFGTPRSSSSECKEEDDSECWKCKKKASCTKFKGFNLN